LRAYEFLRGRFRPQPPVSSMTLPHATAWMTGHSVRIGGGVWKTCGGVVIYRASFAQETGCPRRLDVVALVMAVEHVRARIGVSTGFCRVRSSVLRLARAGSERPPGGGPDRRKPNAGPTGYRKVMLGRGESRRMDRILRDRSPRWISIHVRGPKRGKPCAGSRARPGGQTDVGFFGGTRSEAGR